MIEEDVYSFLIPNFQPSDSQEEKLQSCPFPRGSELDMQSSLSSEEQATGIEVESIPESSDDYQTPPEHHQEVESADREMMEADDSYNRTEEKRLVDITNDTDNVEFLEDNNDTELVDVNDTEHVEVDSTVEETNAPNVFVEMPVREQEASEVNESLDKIGDVDPKGKRRLPGSLNGNGTEKEKEKKKRHGEFLDTMNRALKLLKNEGKSGNEDDDGDCDFLETAMKRGLTFPRPRWWPPEGGSED